MNKIAIPALFVATVMVAGAFALMPVEQASTVHTSGATTLVTDADIDAILLDTGTTIPATITLIDDFVDTEVAAILDDTNATIPTQIDAQDRTITYFAIFGPGSSPGKRLPRSFTRLMSLTTNRSISSSSTISPSIAARPT